MSKFSRIIQYVEQAIFQIVVLILILFTIQNLSPAAETDTTLDKKTSSSIRLQGEKPLSEAVQKTRLYGKVDILNSACTDVGIKLSTNALPASVESVKLGSSAYYAHIDAGDKVLSAEIQDNKFCISIERGGQKYVAEIHLSPEFVSASKNPSLPGNIKETQLQPRIHINGFDGIGGPGGAGGIGQPGFVGVSPGYHNTASGQGGHGDLLDGPSGADGLDVADLPYVDLPGWGRPGRNGRDGIANPADPGELGGPGKFGSASSPKPATQGGRGVNGLPDSMFSSLFIAGQPVADDYIRSHLNLFLDGQYSQGTYKPTGLNSFVHTLPPLKITIELGGSYINNSFNGSKTMHLLMQQFADSLAWAANKYSLAVGSRGAVIVIDKPNRNMYLFNSFDGPKIISFFSDTKPYVIPGRQKLNKIFDNELNEQKLELSPLTIRLNMGTTHLDNSINTNVSPGFGGAFFHKGWELQQPGALAEATYGYKLRPTLIQFHGFALCSGVCFDEKHPDLNYYCSLAEVTPTEIKVVFPDLMHYRDNIMNYLSFRDDEFLQHLYAPGRSVDREAARETDEESKNQSRQSHEMLKKIDQVMSSNYSGGLAQIQAVVSANAGALSRPVIVRITLGGSTISHSFNNNGSLTIMVNEFLDRLTKEVKPSLLANIDHIVFRMNGAHFKNSFND